MVERAVHAGAVGSRPVRHLPNLAAESIFTKKVAVGLLVFAQRNANFQTPHATSMFGQKPPSKKAAAPWGQGETYQPKPSHPGKPRSAVGNPVVHPKQNNPAPSPSPSKAKSTPWEQPGDTYRPKQPHGNAPKSNGNLIAHEKAPPAPSGKSKLTKVEAPWGRGQEDRPKPAVRRL